MSWLENYRCEYLHTHLHLWYPQDYKSQHSASVSCFTFSISVAVIFGLSFSPAWFKGLIFHKTKLRPLRLPIQPIKNNVWSKLLIAAACSCSQLNIWSCLFTLLWSILRWSVINGPCVLLCTIIFSWHRIWKLSCFITEMWKKIKNKVTWFIHWGNNYGEFNVMAIYFH